MQDLLSQIFQKALQEMPDKLHAFSTEDAIFYRGFKISRTDGIYKWEDTRFSDYYEPVDPMITEVILAEGFKKTLKKVMLHDDLEKIDLINRKIEDINNEIKHWVSLSTKLYAEYNKKRDTIVASPSAKQEIKSKLDALHKRYEQRKRLYQKKRRVLSLNRGELKANKKFLESRIKLYNN